MKIEIREETEKDFFETEKMVRESFWNKYRPGCNEPYMVHVMRSHETFLPQFSRIALVDGKIAGAIMYFKSKIKQADGREIQVASFGPLCVSHKYRNLGIGRRLIEETMPLVKEAGFPGVLIVGEPEYYPKIGFIRCRERGITDAEGNSWDPYMLYEFEKDSMKIPGVFEEPYDITDAIPQVPPMDYENQFEDWTPMAVPCQFEYANPSDESNGYHLRRAEERPREFAKFFEKAESPFSSAKEIMEDPLMAQFMIEKGADEIGMCLVSCKGSKPELISFFVEEEFHSQGIEEDISRTFEEMNK